MKDQGWSLYPAATPPVVNRGITFAGAGRYAQLSNLRPLQAFASGPSDELSIAVEFTPSFNYDDAAEHRCIFDTSVALRYLAFKSKTGPGFRINVYFGLLSLILFADAPAYSAYWLLNASNILTIAGKPGANVLYLNSNVIATSATPWAKSNPDSVVLGNDNTAVMPFAGKITDFSTFNRKLSAAEVAAL
jgi:hypothetical protein